MVDKKSGEIIQGHNEAPRSATVKVISAKGFYWMVTVREETFGELLKDMEAAEDLLLSRGWKAEEPRQGGFGGFTPKPKIVTGKCSIHNEDMTERISKKTGKPYSAHTRGDFKAGTSEMCFGEGYPSEKEKHFASTPSEPPTRDITEDF